MCVYTDADGSRRYRTDFLQDLPTPGTGPSFDTSIPSILTGLVGKTVYINCRVKNLGIRRAMKQKDLTATPEFGRYSGESLRTSVCHPVTVEMKDNEPLRNAEFPPHYGN
ncbi:hypothetical protein J6590_092708 [Homalodisca vitripennis]|nr:hypothetical protein J6590_092708 [Homalodisca vitripennis]